MNIARGFTVTDVPQTFPAVCCTSRADRHGPSTGRHGPSTDRHGPSTDRHGPSTDRYGPSTDRHGPSTDRQTGSINRQTTSINQQIRSINRQTWPINRQTRSITRQTRSITKHGPGRVHLIDTMRVSAPLSPVLTHSCPRPHPPPPPTPHLSHSLLPAARLSLVPCCTAQDGNVRQVNGGISVGPGVD